MGRKLPLTLILGNPVGMRRAEVVRPRPVLWVAPSLALAQWLADIKALVDLAAL
jgi:hypothetical protein